MKYLKKKLFCGWNFLLEYKWMHCTNEFNKFHLIGFYWNLISCCGFSFAFCFCITFHLMKSTFFSFNFIWNGKVVREIQFNHTANFFAQTILSSFSVRLLDTDWMWNRIQKYFSIFLSAIGFFVWEENFCCFSVLSIDENFPNRFFVQIQIIEEEKKFFLPSVVFHWNFSAFFMKPEKMINYE